MGRLLFWMLLAMLVYALARNRLGSGARRARAGQKPPEAMVRCATCGLNVPQSEALSRDGQWYCGKDHMERARPADRDGGALDDR